MPKSWEFRELTSNFKYISSAGAAKYVNEQIILNKPVYVKDISAAFKKAASEYKESSEFAVSRRRRRFARRRQRVGGVTNVDIIPDTVKEPYSDLEVCGVGARVHLKAYGKGYSKRRRKRTV